MLFQEVEKMELVIITTDTLFDHEAEAINTLCKEGVQVLHRRKPQSTKEQMELLLKQINPFYLNRMVLHDHFDLVQQFGLKGYHLNSRNKEVTRDRGKSISAYDAIINDIYLGDERIHILGSDKRFIFIM